MVGFSGGCSNNNVKKVHREGILPIFDGDLRGIRIDCRIPLPVFKIFLSVGFADSFYPSVDGLVGFFFADTDEMTVDAQDIPAKGLVAVQVIHGKGYP
jgi:hypothetical protein